MYTSTELQYLRSIDGGASLPGIDTPTGNQLPAASLIKANTLPGYSATGPGYYYDPIQDRVVVYQDGVTLSGIDFGSALLQINANNVTVTSCTFEPTHSYYSIFQSGSGATIENSTFTGPKYSTELADFVASGNEITIKGNSFIDAAADAIHIVNGVVAGNYFSGGAYADGAHSDAIYVTGTTTGVSITNNFIDWTQSSDGSGAGTNDAVRITGEGGDVNNVTVSGNYLIGGRYTIGGGSGDPGVLTNVNVSGNYIGFGLYGAYYPGLSTFTFSGNTIFDWTNPSYSTNAWTSYLAAGLPTTNVVVSTGYSILNSSTKSTTLYGAGYNQVDLYGTTSLAETNYVGGYGRQFLLLGSGANIVTELAVADSSTISGVDSISGFDTAKDVIDLSRIDANLSVAGIQNFTYIGTAAFSGSGAQVRYEIDGGTTTVQAKLAGDSSADLTMTLGGSTPLSAANFALTAAASKSAATEAASLSVTRSASGSAAEFSYTGVTGHSYTTYNSISTGGAIVAEDFTANATTSLVSLIGSNVAITRGSSAESIVAGTGKFSQSYHANETLQIGSTAGAETVTLGSHFGSETVTGFVASGTNADAIVLPVASFSYLSASMSQAQDLAAVLGHATSGAAGLAIKDSFGDTLTLTGMTATTLASSSAIRFV